MNPQFLELLTRLGQQLLVLDLAHLGLQRVQLGVVLEQQEVALERRLDEREVALEKEDEAATRTYEEAPGYEDETLEDLLLLE